MAEAAYRGVTCTQREPSQTGGDVGERSKPILRSRSLGVLADDYLCSLFMNHFILQIRYVRFGPKGQNRQAQRIEL